MLGFELPENLNLPNHARNPSEFWSRWHMTLSRWIRDYLFFPLNMKAGRRTWLRYVFLVLVMTSWVRGTERAWCSSYGASGTVS